MRTFLIGAWAAASVFFVWEFLAADSIPAKYAKANPWAFRAVDVIFLVVIVATIIYLYKHP